MENDFNNNKPILSACRTTNFKSLCPLSEKPLGRDNFDQND